MAKNEHKQPIFVSEATAGVATLLTEAAELAIDKHAIGVIVLMVLPGVQVYPLHIETAPCMSVSTIVHVCKQAADAALAGKAQAKFLAVSGQDDA